jgi:diketogulonate reductase-like aldo/keto reductase
LDWIGNQVSQSHWRPTPELVRTGCRGKLVGEEFAGAQEPEVAARNVELAVIAATELSDPPAKRRRCQRVAAGRDNGARESAFANALQFLAQVDRTYLHPEPASQQRVEDHLPRSSRSIARREPARSDPSREVPEHQRHGLLERQRRWAHEHEAFDLELDAAGEGGVDGEHCAEGVPGQREGPPPRATTLDDPPTVGGDRCAARDERRWLGDRPAGRHRASVDPGVGSPTGDEEPAHGDYDTRQTPVMVSDIPQPIRDLGSGVSMPMLGLGVWQVKDGPETEQAVEWALEAGYRHIDTAQYYRNERGVGTALAHSGLPREDVFVTTKWLPVSRGPVHELEQSLERLGLAYVDLYLIHWPLPGRTGGAWQEFEELRERGLARAVGVSNYGVKRLADLLVHATRPPAVNQVLFSPLHYRRKLLEFCEQRGVVLEAYSPLERGGALDNPTVVEVARRVERTPAQVMLRWGIQRDAVVIPKSVHRDRIRENAAIFDFSLSDQDMRALDALDRTDGTGRAR